jgi:probable F420-dependent oxidoreductase
MEYAFGALAQGVFAKPENLSLLAKTGEKLGFEVMWFNDHIVMPRAIGSRYPYSDTGRFNEFGEGGDYLEQLTLLSYVAAQTSRVKLLTSVMVVPYRDPVLTAKILATVDVLSKGRVILGCGAGWMREEFEALGRPPYEERGSVTDEYIRVFKNLWTEGEPSYAGKYVSYSNVAFEPKPVQKPHPPIWIGGESLPALRRTARVGDAWFPIIDNPRHRLDTAEHFSAGVAQMRRVAEQEGRDPDTIDVAFAINIYDDSKEREGRYGNRRVFTGNAEQIASDLRDYTRHGVRCVMFGFDVDPVSPNATLEQMQRFIEEVRPLVGE